MQVNLNFVKGGGLEWVVGQECVFVGYVGTEKFCLCRLFFVPIPCPHGFLRFLFHSLECTAVTEITKQMGVEFFFMFTYCSCFYIYVCLFKSKLFMPFDSCTTFTEICVHCVMI